MLSYTAPVGQGVLRNAVRLLKNYQEETEVAVFDPEKTGCSKCVIRSTPNLCKDCLLKCYKMETKKIYHNESARYGKKASLSRNAILLLLWLHFNNPDEKGFIRSFDAHDAAASINCHSRTIVNNLTCLSDYGYVSFSHLPVPGYYSVQLTDYEMYFAPANLGGRGYITMSKEMFDILLEQEDLNSLRLAIRGILTASEQSRKDGIIEEKPYADIKRELPAYVTKDKIIHILESTSFRKLFDVNGTKKYTVSLKLKDAFSIGKIKETLVEGCHKAVSECIHSINSKGSSKKLVISDEDIRNISNIGLRYPASFITEALKEVYKTYICQSLPIKDIGALVRTVTKSMAARQDIFQLA